MSRRNEELRQIDFFSNPLRQELEHLLSEIHRHLHAKELHAKQSTATPGGVWVTRKGIHVDRIASAWLIKRFIDADARFRFVDARTYTHQAEELRFDMFEGEFTHQGDSCTFEVLLAANNLRPDKALVAVAEIIHDIDLKDDRYQRPETAGVKRVIDGLCAQNPTDELRL